MSWALFYYLAQWRRIVVGLWIKQLPNNETEVDMYLFYAWIPVMVAQRLTEMDNNVRKDLYIKQYMVIDRPWKM
jgi:hypothetical protein